jgi:hypothetical protein
MIRPKPIRIADSSQSEQQTPESRSFVSSYSRASFRYMEENVGLPDHLVKYIHFWNKIIFTVHLHTD